MLKYKREKKVPWFSIADQGKTYLMAIDVHPKDGKIFESPNFIFCPKITIMNHGYYSVSFLHMCFWNGSQRLSMIYYNVDMPTLCQHYLWGSLRIARQHYRVGDSQRTVELSQRRTRRACRAEWWERLGSSPQMVVKVPKTNGVLLGKTWVISHVPMFHITQPLDSIRYMVFFMATIRWCPIFPKWDIYQPL